jgi:lipoate---protein ligase
VKLLDLTLPTPAQNLACDEALLNLCEEAGLEVLRFWESRETFVVLGYGNHFATEVNVAECQRRQIPILRRCSGGGTVVQGPGCLNYNLTLRVEENSRISSVTEANRYVMERQRAAMEKFLGVPVSIQGCTDLAFASGNGPDDPASHPPPAPKAWFKFSGNAQRRRRGALVFHGTLLYGFDLKSIGDLLRFPSAQPDYRDSRSHLDFVRNVPTDGLKLRRALSEAWNAVEPAPAPSDEMISRLVAEQYGNEAWNLRV